MQVTTSYPTIDGLYRATWQAIAKMYNEEASKHDTTIATGMALLSIDPVHGTPSTAIAPKWAWKPLVYRELLKLWRKKGLLNVNLTLMMAEVFY